MSIDAYEQMSTGVSDKFDCLVNEMLLIEQLRPCLSEKSDSSCALAFV